MRNSATVEEPRPSPAPAPLSPTAAIVESGGARSSIASAAVSVCVVCCSTQAMPHDTLHAAARAVGPAATVRKVLLSETGAELEEGVEVITVPCGTKLSKLRRLPGLVDADLFVICDPDLAVEEDAARLVVEEAVVAVRAGEEVVAFGIVKGADDGTLLSRVVAVDKWLSHRVLRPLLWALGAGATLPGQFLVVSRGLLRRLDPAIDSHLDDLYLGWLARQHGVPVRRVGVVVGEEGPRGSLASLLAQRVRWMRGLACLIGSLFPHPSAVGLLGLHYLAYHGLPVLVMVAVATLTARNPPAGLLAFFGLAALLSAFSRRPFFAAATFLIVFPVVHAIATLLWWVPVSRALLTRR